MVRDKFVVKKSFVRKVGEFLLKMNFSKNEAFNFIKIKIRNGVYECTIEYNSRVFTRQHRDLQVCKENVCEEFLHNLSSPKTHDDTVWLKNHYENIGLSQLWPVIVGKIYT